jgi:Mg2+-importing ATPase
MLKREKINTALKSLGKTNGQSSEFDSASALRLKQAAASGKASFLEMLQTRADGLSAAEVKEHLLTYGLNEVSHEKAPAWYVQFIQAFINPFIGVLLILSIISLITDVIIQAPNDRDYTTVAVIFTMVMLSAMLRFVQEFRSNQAAEKLKSMVKTTATVKREDEGKQELDIKHPPFCRGYDPC